MAKKAPTKENGNINKSQAIRDALEKTPDASPKQLAAELVARGIEVSPSYISIIKSGLRSKAKSARRSGRPKQGGNGGTVVVASEIVAVKKLVDKVGSIEKAESLLGTLRRLL